MRPVRMVLGGPGTGKTTRLLRVVHDELAAGVRPDRIAFVSFTRSAVREAADRARAAFGLGPDDLPYFRTLHSIAYRELSLTRDDVLSGRHMREISELLNVPITGNLRREDGEIGQSKIGDRLLYIDHLARATKRPLEDVWSDGLVEASWFDALQFSQTVAAYKRSYALLDFADMLDRYAAEGKPLPVDVVIVDEAQDLTPAQWAMVDVATADAKRVYVGGDDDQAIYAWAGADVRAFQDLPVIDREVLPLSYRLPRAVFSVAQGVIGRVERRFPKAWSPRPEDGAIDREAAPELIDFSKGTWLVLARNAYHLNVFKEQLVKQEVSFTCHGVPSVDPVDLRAILAYERWRREGTIEEDRVREVEDRMGRTLADRGIWHDAMEAMPIERREYYLGIRRSGARLADPPRVALDTIHGSKGGEAENVVLMTDISKRTEAGFDDDPDSEHRVFYVGATRARERLIVLEPQTSRSYPI